MKQYIADDIINFLESEIEVARKCRIDAANDLFPRVAEKWAKREHDLSFGLNHFITHHAMQTGSHRIELPALRYGGTG